MSINNEYESFLDLVKLFTNSHASINPITEKGEWSYSKMNQIVNDYEMRNITKNIIEVLIGATEGGIASQITNDFVLSFAIAGGTIIVHKIIEPIFEGQELNMPNGNYTVETITRTEEFGSFTKLTESFELYLR